MSTLRWFRFAALISVMLSCATDAGTTGGEGDVASSTQALTSSNCSADAAYGCAAYGCGCIDNACNGGFCAGSGCTTDATNFCAAYGCGCADGACAAGFCAGAGCTAREISDCQAAGQGCYNHACTPAAPSSVGATDGEFSVGQGGDVNYSIPIKVVPGTGGAQPSLSFVYNNSGEDTPLGVGWMMSGQSSITRCPATLEQDGFIDPVDFDANDRFCLDGQRLVAVNGTYGGNGTEYRTEVDTQARIISYGNAPFGGPDRFVVWRKDGMIAGYGHTPDSLLEAYFPATPTQPGPIVAWTINQLNDRLGNYIVYTYEEKAGEQNVTRIDYGGAGTFAYADVRFVWEPRPDPSDGYQAGAQQALRRRLKRVLTDFGSSVAHRYELFYGQSTAANRSTLSAIQECGSDGSCFAPTRFEVGAQTVGFEATSRPVQSGFAGGVHPHSTNAKNETLVDLDGDGDLDRSWIPDGRFDVWAALWNGTSFDTPTLWLPAGNGYNSFSDNGRYTVWTDLNGDSKADYVWIPFKRSDIFVALSTGTSFLPPQIWHSPGPVLPWSDGAVLETYADATGDGLADRVFARNGAVYVLRNTGTSFGYVEQWIAKPSIPLPLNFSAGAKQQDFVDVNGDGRVDFVWVPQDRADLYVALSNGNSFDPSTIWLSNATASYRELDSDRYVDMNGDGLPDRVVTPAGNASSVQVSINTGASFLPAVTWITGNEASGNAADRIYSTDPRNEQLVDLNDDMRTDRVWVNTLTNTVWVTYAIEEQDAAGKVSMRFGAPSELINRSVGGTPYAAVNSAEFAAREFYVDVTGDGAVDKIYSPPDGVLEFRVIPGRRVSHRLEKITNGLGAQRRIEYATLFDPTVYTMDRDAVFPVMDGNGAMDVVHFVRTSDGIGGFQTKRYAYAGLKLHAQGLGNLGMRQTIEVDEPGIGFSIRTYSQDFTKRLQGALLTDGRVGPGFVALLATTNSYTTQVIQGGEAKRFVNDVSESTTVNNDLNGAFLSKTRLQNLELDGFGNTTRLRRTVMDASDVVQLQTDVVTTYQNDASIWSLGLPTRSVITQTQPNASPPTQVVRTVDASFDVAKRLVVSETNEPNTPELRLDRQYLYDSFGNRTSTTISGFDVPTRTSTATFDVIGRFPIRGQNALGLVTQASFDPRDGSLTGSTDPNNVVTTAEYDGFGRPMLQTDPGGIETMTETLRCDAGCPATAAFFVRVTPQGGTPRATYFDVLNRTVREETWSLEGKRTLVDRRYDSRGRNTHISEPYFESATPLWTVITFDDVNRAVRGDNPNGTSSTVSYNGPTVVATNELGQTQTTISNVLNQPIESRDTTGAAVRYRYDGYGNAIEVRDPAGNVITTTYDRQGRKTSINDPSKGLYTFTYDALDRLRRQTDAKAQVSEASYDLLGRLTMRVEGLGGAQQQITLQSYDTAANGKGQLAGVKQLRCTGAIATCQNTANTSPEYAELYSYDSLGRRTRTETRIGAESFLVDAAFDSLGRIVTTTYPDSAGQRFRVRGVYNANGYLTELRNDLAGQTLWTASTSDARGNLTAFTLGNGLTTKRSFDATTGFLTKIETGTTNTPASVQNLETTFDAVGNLAQRRDARIDFTETAGYDSLNRLVAVTSKLGSAAATSVNIAYDQLGNIVSRTGTGTYSYAKSCTGGKAGPHAVTSITNGSVTTSYCYDNNGNMTQSGARTIDWAPFDLPTRFKQGTLESRFEYGPSRQRYRRVDTGGSAGTTTTVNIGGLFERVTKLSSTEYRNLIGDFAVYKRTVTTSTATATFYLHTDHLGSVNAITDASRTVVERFNFDAWGNRRAVSGEKTTTSAHTLRGFTNQEQIDDFKLVHMNGRVYDPTIGRFISADPFVQEPQNLQSLNRYSYVINNPFSFTDPSGFRFSHFVRNFRKLFNSPILGGPAVRLTAKVFMKYPGVKYFIAFLCGGNYIAAIIYGIVVFVVDFVGGGARPGAAFKDAVITAAAGYAARYLIRTGLEFAGGLTGPIGGKIAVVANFLLRGVAAQRLLGSGLTGFLSAAAKGEDITQAFTQGFKVARTLTFAQIIGQSFMEGAASVLAATGDSETPKPQLNDPLLIPGGPPTLAPVNPRPPTERPVNGEELRVDASPQRVKKAPARIDERVEGIVRQTTDPKEPLDVLRIPSSILDRYKNVEAGVAVVGGTGQATSAGAFVIIGNENVALRAAAIGNGDQFAVRADVIVSF